MSSDSSPYKEIGVSATARPGVIERRRKENAAGARSKQPFERAPALGHRWNWSLFRGAVCAHCGHSRALVEDVKCKAR